MTYFSFNDPVYLWDCELCAPAHRWQVMTTTEWMSHLALHIHMAIESQFRPIVDDLKKTPPSCK